MPGPRTASYGSWRSPITSEMIAAGSVRLSQPAIDGECLYWLESRPLEGGREALVRRAADGSTADMVAAPYSVRTRVHEYGGGAYAVAGGVVYFANFADQRLYRLEPGGSPSPLTPEAPRRYADIVVDAPRRRLICVREDHTEPGRPPDNLIADVPLDGLEGRVLVRGGDFYSSPRLSPDGTRLAWLTWDHPNMPWDGTELWLGQLDDDGRVHDKHWVAGGPSESIFQPEWSPDGRLHFVSDRTGWWNLYRLGDDGMEPLWPLEAEFGVPQWVFGMATYAFESADRLVCAYNVRGTWRLAAIDTGDLTARPIESPYTVFGSLRAAPGSALFICASPTEPDSLVRLDLGSGEHGVLRRPLAVPVDRCYLSLPEAIEFATEHDLTAHALYYPPANRDYAAPAPERPPLLVVSHGGPTAATSARFDLAVQYWTSRGVAVLDVNYGGSSGHGRQYRERLNGNWGIVDVDDCANGALYLAELGQVDGSRLAIRGGSAGGYTTLCALVFRDVFATGASYFGVSDLEALAGETHKFESRYLDRLIGPYPEAADLYRERSPIHAADRLARPVIFFQGLEDAIVPPNQAEVMVNALRLKGLPVAYLAFPGEQHGFRRAENIRRCLEAELYFYSRILSFPLGDPVDPIAIENLPIWESRKDAKERSRKGGTER